MTSIRVTAKRSNTSSSNRKYQVQTYSMQDVMNASRQRQNATLDDRDFKKKSAMNLLGTERTQFFIREGSFVSSHNVSKYYWPIRNCRYTNTSETRQSRSYQSSRSEKSVNIKQKSEGSALLRNIGAIHKSAFKLNKDSRNGKSQAYIVPPIIHISCEHLKVPKIKSRYIPKSEKKYSRKDSALEQLKLIKQLVRKSREATKKPSFPIDTLLHLLKAPCDKRNGINNLTGITLQRSKSLVRRKWSGYKIESTLFASRPGTHMKTSREGLNFVNAKRVKRSNNEAFTPIKNTETVRSQTEERTKRKTISKTPDPNFSNRMSMFSNSLLKDKIIKIPTKSIVFWNGQESGTKILEYDHNTFEHSNRKLEEENSMMGEVDDSPIKELVPKYDNK